MNKLMPWLLAFGGITAVTWIGHEMLHLNPSTVGFAFLIVVLL